MARNEEVRLPGLSPSMDGKLYPQIIEQVDSASVGLTDAFIGEGHELTFRGIHRHIVVGVNDDNSPQISDAFAHITPVIYTATYEGLNDSKVAEEGFTYDNIRADMAKGLVTTAEPIEIMRAHTKSGAYVRQIEAARTVLGDNPAEIIGLYSRLSQWVVAASAGLSNATNATIDISDGQGRTADSIFIPDDAKLTVAQVVDMDDFSTANVDPRTLTGNNADGIKEHETRVGSLTVGPHATKADGTTNFEEIEFSIRGPEFGIPTKAAGFIVRTSGKVIDVSSDHKQDGKDRVAELFSSKLKVL